MKMKEVRRPRANVKKKYYNQKTEKEGKTKVNSLN